MNVEVRAPQTALQRLLQVIELLDSPNSLAPAELADVVAELREVARELPGRGTPNWRAEHEEAAEQALAQRLRYQELFDSAPDGYLVLDRFGVIFETNHAAADLLQTRREFLAGKPLAFFLAAGWRSDFYRRLTRTAGGVQRWESVVRPARGAPRFVEMTLAPDGDQPAAAVSGLRCMLRDITGRKQAELALRREQALSDTLINTVEAVVLVVDANGVVLRCNPYVLDSAGLRREEVVGRDWCELLDPANWPAARQLVAEALRRGAGAPAGEAAQAAFGGLCRLAGRGGRRPMAWAARVLAEIGSTPRLVLLGHDVSELQEAQERALQAERLAAIGQMAAALAHEGRNALQRTMACLAMLEMRLYDQEEARDLILRAQKAQDDLLRLFEDVRMFSAPVRLELGLYDLAEIWREAWSELGPAAAGGVLSEETEGVDLHCIMCPFHLRQVFRNLLENALAATQGAGHVVIRAAATELDERDALRIAICDNGPGFAPEQRQKAFEPFYTTKARGTGLGLAICKRLVEAHGGTIEVEAREGLGGQIVVTLPRRSS